MYTFATRMTMLRTLQPGGSRLSGRIRRHFLACEVIACGSQLSRGESFFLLIIWTHFLACEDVAGGSQQSGGNVFFAKYGGPFGGSLMSCGGIVILRVIRRHFLACGCGTSCRPLHVQSTSDGCCSLTMLTRPRREHQGGGRRQGLGRKR